MPRAAPPQPAQRANPGTTRVKAWIDGLRSKIFTNEPEYINQVYSSKGRDETEDSSDLDKEIPRATRGKNINGNVRSQTSTDSRRRPDAQMSRQSSAQNVFKQSNSVKHSGQAQDDNESTPPLDSPLAIVDDQDDDMAGRIVYNREENARQSRQQHSTSQRSQQERSYGRPSDRSVLSYLGDNEEDQTKQSQNTISAPPQQQAQIVPYQYQPVAYTYGAQPMSMGGAMPMSMPMQSAMSPMLPFPIFTYGGPTFPQFMQAPAVQQVTTQLPQFSGSVGGGKAATVDKDRLIRDITIEVSKSIIGQLRKRTSSTRKRRSGRSGAVEDSFSELSGGESSGESSTGSESSIGMNTSSSSPDSSIREQSDEKRHNTERDSRRSVGSNHTTNKSPQKQNRKQKACDKEERLSSPATVRELRPKRRPISPSKEGGAKKQRTNKAQKKRRGSTTTTQATTVSDSPKETLQPQHIPQPLFGTTSFPTFPSLSATKSSLFPITTMDEQPKPKPNSGRDKKTEGFSGEHGDIVSNIGSFAGTNSVIGEQDDPSESEITVSKRFSGSGFFGFSPDSAAPVAAPISEAELKRGEDNETEEQDKADMAPDESDGQDEPKGKQSPPETNQSPFTFGSAATFSFGQSPTTTTFTFGAPVSQDTSLADPKIKGPEAEDPKKEDKPTFVGGMNFSFGSQSLLTQPSQPQAPIPAPALPAQPALQPNAQGEEKTSQMSKGDESNVAKVDEKREPKAESVGKEGNAETNDFGWLSNAGANSNFGGADQPLFSFGSSSLATTTAPAIQAVSSSGIPNPAAEAHQQAPIQFGFGGSAQPAPTFSFGDPKSNSVSGAASPTALAGQGGATGQAQAPFSFGGGGAAGGLSFGGNDNSGGSAPFSFGGGGNLFSFGSSSAAAQQPMQLAQTGQTQQAFSFGGGSNPAAGAGGDAGSGQTTVFSFGGSSGGGAFGGQTGAFSFGSGGGAAMPFSFGGGGSGGGNAGVFSFGK